MQSLNEELETSREELQSSNEELVIVNQELLDKQQQLNTERLYQGTGIGLALSKKIIENHHGEIYVEAQENSVASFHIILPIQQFRSIMSE